MSFFVIFKNQWFIRWSYNKIDAVASLTRWLAYQNSLENLHTYRSRSKNKKKKKKNPCYFLSLKIPLIEVGFYLIIGRNELRIRLTDTTQVAVAVFEISVFSWVYFGKLFSLLFFIVFCRPYWKVLGSQQLKKNYIQKYWLGRMKSRIFSPGYIKNCL